jgi:hypothetical protein
MKHLVKRHQRRTTGGLPPIWRTWSSHTNGEQRQEGDHQYEVPGQVTPTENNRIVTTCMKYLVKRHKRRVTTGRRPQYEGPGQATPTENNRMVTTRVKDLVKRRRNWVVSGAATLIEWSQVGKVLSLHWPRAVQEGPYVMCISSTQRTTVP